MDIGNLVNLNKSSQQSATQLGLRATLSGLVTNPDFGPTAQHGQTLQADVTIEDGSTPQLSYQWCTAQSGEIAGATSATFTVDATLYDEQSVFCRISTDDMRVLSTSSSMVRHIPPTVLSPLADQIFDQDTGDQSLPIAGVFGGDALSTSASGAIATFDEPSQSILIDTSSVQTASVVVLQATNSGGSVQTQFLVTVEADTSQDMNVVVHALTAAGGNPIPVTGTAIASGDPLGHWQLVNQELSPSAAGDQADLSEGGYVLVLDDSSVITVSITQQISETDWALSSPSETGFDVVIFAVPEGATDIEFSLNAGAWTSLGTTAPGIYTLGGLEPETAYRISLRAFDGTGGAVSSKSISTVPQDPLGFRGWEPGIDLGTTGDLYVAPFGDDTATGTETAPLRTINAALSQSSAGDTIKIRAGKYRELLMLPHTITLEGYGTEKPEITASELLEGFVQCDASDVDIIGPLLGTTNSPVYKTVLAKSAVDHGAILALNLYEAGKRLFPATDRADMSDLFNDLDKHAFHTADGMGLNGNGKVITITDSDVLTSARYTEDQLLDADVLLLHYPTVISRQSITAVDLANNTITIDGERTPQTAGTVLDRYALTNVGPQLIPGTYYVEDDGGPNISLYIRPYLASNLDQIEFSPRQRVIEMPHDANAITLRGLHLSRASGDGSFRGVNLYKGDTSIRTDNHVFEHILSSGVFNSTDPARSIRLNFIGHSTIRNVTTYDLMNGVGIFISGGGKTTVDGVITERNPGVFNLIEKCHLVQIGRTPYIAYQQFNLVFAHILTERAAIGAHANKANAYEQCDNVLWWGVEFGRQVQGYLTWQEASNIAVAFSMLPVYMPQLNNQRVLVDQANTTPPPILNSQGYLFNNTVLPQVENLYQGPNISLSNSLNDMTMTIVNNIAQSITAPPHTPLPYDLFSGNIITKLTTGVNNQTLADFPAGNVVETDLAAVYVDAISGDFTPVASSPILTLPGLDMRSLVTQLQTTYPQFSAFDRDYKNQLIDWDILPIGADANLSFDRIPVLSDPQGAATSATSATGSVTTNLGLGTLYAGLWDSATPPADSAALKAGTGAEFLTSNAVTAAGEQGFTATGLTGNQTLTWHFLHETNAGEQMLSGMSVTLSGSGSTGPNLMPDPGFDLPDRWSTNSGHLITGGQFEITAAAVSFSSTSTHANHPILVQANKTYTFSIDVVAVTAGHRLRVFVAERDGTADLSTITAFDTSSSGAVSAGDQITFEITTQAATQELRLTFNKISGLDVVLDNVSCREIS